jgi:F420-dependent methylenetetrahydromethanopterin dehydrogenase
MPDQHTDAEAKLRKLGQRLRQAWAKQHPIPERSLDTVKNAVREEWEKEQVVSRRPGPSAPGPAKGKERKPEEPDRER